MTQTVIQVENLSKQYRIGGRQESYGSLRESLSNTLLSTINRFKNGRLRAQPETIWALKNVSFDVQQGEVVGIIGRNGAGKSTLLKILSRITKPTEGTVRLRGRVGSLLEVGTGFHPELTGRENIYLNGAILGMSRIEIDRKFDEIVAFSEIEKFLDTPVKRYSSGMYVRLAFAVAAHLEPEILLVDEVLAVGDAAFQKKCLGKMGEVAEDGRTVIFVSHNMGAVQRLCTKSIWFFDGTICQEGSSLEVVRDYIENTLLETKHTSSRRFQRDDSINEATYEAIQLLDNKNNISTVFPSSSEMIIEAKIKVKKKSIEVQCGFDFVTLDDVLVSNVNSRMIGQNPIYLEKDSIISWKIKELRLMPGKYQINLRMKDKDERDFLDYWKSAMVFEVLPADVYKTGFLLTQNTSITYLPVSIEIRKQ